jgi:hypothetical protein
MIITSPYHYQTIKQINKASGRVYDTGESTVPSVTTILSKTEPAEKKQKLAEWSNRVGAQQAQQITKEAANVGTFVHAYLEHWIKGIEYNPGNNLIHTLAKQMASEIIKYAEPRISEIWGIEAPLFYPGLYAGTSDLIAMWDNKPCILDFKQTNKPKKREWIDSYFLQGAAYAMAHDEVHGTSINNITILMVSRACEFQCFEVNTKSEMDMWKTAWARRVDQYYSQ